VLRSVLGGLGGIVLLARSAAEGPAVISIGCLGRSLTVEELTEASAVMEGWELEGSLVQRLNNPGALSYAGQNYATRTPEGWARFDTPVHGWEAAYADFRAKRRVGLDLEGIIARRSGPGDDQELYRKSVLSIARRKARKK
jgi:hypothetical protein